MDENKYHVPRSNNISKPTAPNTKKCLVFLCILCILVNPIFGIISLLAALKSRREKCEDSRRLTTISQHISVAGIIISLAFVALVMSMYLLDEKAFDFILIAAAAVTRNESNSTSNSTTSLRIITTQLKHRLHFNIDSISTTFALSNVTGFRQQPRDNNNQTNFIALLLNTTTLPPLKYYDRISILIDHNLLKKLKFDYEFLNKTLK